MSRLTRIFLAATIALLMFSAAMTCAVIQEARDRSAAVEAVYKIGLEDGAQFTRDRIKRAEAMAELLEESKAHKLTLKPL